jgi:hypothetical protein
LLVPWLAELVRTLPGTVRHSLDLRTRQQVSLAVAEVNASRPWIWAYQAWRDFLGPTVIDEEIIAYAQACAGGGRPVETFLPSGVRATVAWAELASLAANGVEAFGERVRGRRPWRSAGMAWDTGVALVALPLTVPALAAAGLVRAAAQLAPPIPVAEVGEDDEANLLVAVLAHAVPQLLGNAAVRTALVGLPATVTVGVRAGEIEATVRLGRRRLAIDNGIAADARIVIDVDAASIAGLAAAAMASVLTPAP